MLAVLLAACRPQRPPAAAGAQELQAEVGGIYARYEPGYHDYYERDEKNLHRGDGIMISFPSPMTTPANLGLSSAQPPVQFKPELACKFKWVSVTECAVTVTGEPCPDTEYRLCLRAGLTDAAGLRLAVPNWGLNWKPRAFKVQLEGRLGFENNERDYDRLLSAQPKFRLRFSHPVSANEVAGTVLWRDETHATIGSDVQLVVEDERASQTCFDVTPREPLAAGHRYELLVDNTHCLLGGVLLPYPHVLALGHTLPMKIESVGAFNQPKEGAFVTISYNQSVDPSSVPATPLKVEPAVAVSRTEVIENGIRIFGDFKTGTRYSVAVAAGMRGRTGYVLAKAENWKVTFHSKRPAVILSRSILTTPAVNGLDVDFVQVNTGGLYWRLAEVPPEALLSVHARLNEYREWDKALPVADSPNQELRLNQTELLVPGLKLPVFREGEIAASGGDEEVVRTIRFQPGEIPAGVYLLEIAGPTTDGRVAGNRALVFVNREFLVWKQMPDGYGGRIFDVVTGDPVRDALLRLYDRKGELMINTQTDEDGAFFFKSGKEVREAEVALIEREGRNSAHFGPLCGGGWCWRVPDKAKEEVRQWLFTDRRIYRPGETVKVHGIVRQVSAEGKLEMPAAGAMDWVLKRNENSEPVMTGKSDLGAAGSWESELALPAEIPLGHYTLEAAGTRCDVKVDEFRAPAFAVEVEPIEKRQDARSTVRVVSHLLQGAPNARAVVRWRAVWTAHRPYEWNDGKDEYVRTADYESPGLELRRPRWARTDDECEKAEAESRELTYDGTTVLDANGVASLESTAAFPPRARLVFAQVRWEVTVIATDGQAVVAETNQILPLKCAQPAIGLRTDRHEQNLLLTAMALNAAEDSVDGVPLHVELYRVEEKSVCEKVSSHVVRYRNTPVFTRLQTWEIKTPFRTKIPVEQPGRYVAVTMLGQGDDAPRASTEAYVCGQSRAEYAQWDDNTIELKPDRERYRVGETAHVALLAPFAGKCWVTVETDRILSSQLVTLAANATGVDVQVTKDMHPNAHVSVFLFRPFSSGETAERLGTCELCVVRPETHLELTTTLESEQVEPGATIQGSVQVACEGKPVAGAELTIFSVDEAILRYGRWFLPDPASVFFPHVAHDVSTWSGIEEFKPGSEDVPLFQKGFLLGDGGTSWRNQFVRSRFRALAFWQGKLKTDAEGRVRFSFEAPDNLTAYRIVAVAQGGAEAFGHNEKQVKIARKLQAEPALPRFVRNGDEVDLRVIVRQREMDRMPVKVVCQVKGATVDGATESVIELEQGLPAPVVFRARVEEGSTRLQVKFLVEAQNALKLQDAVELDLPVKPPTVLIRESVAGEIPPTPWKLPADWMLGKGSVDLVCSRSPWLPLFEGLPSLLEYPHGCSEQVSGRVLAFALMADLLKTLPDGEAREPEYRKRVSEGLYRLSRAQLSDGGVAYWPGQTEANPFVTIQSAWAVIEAQNSGFKVSPVLADGLKTALTKIVRKQNRVRVTPSLRAFAMMVYASLDPSAKPRAEALELYQQRDELGEDGCAFLALALQRFDLLPEEKKQLLAEFSSEAVERMFDADLFNSTWRSAALKFCARTEIEGHAWTKTELEAQRNALTKLTASSQDPSTQENLWLLLAFRSLLRLDRQAGGPEELAAGADGMRSRDGQSVGWYGQSLDAWVKRVGEAAVPMPGARSYYLRAVYRRPQAETRKDRGFRVERVVRDLTSAERDGSAAKPFQIGDELEVIFRVWSQRPQAYVALEESLPAAFETIDPEYYRTTHLRQMAEGAGRFDLSLSHWEKRDDSTLWYFDRMDEGAHSYSVIVRVTSSGRLHWPGVKVAPMYDARFSGLSEASVIEVR